MRRAALLQAAAYSLLLTVSVPTSAQQAPSFVAAGAASIPEYEGSADRTAVPFLAGRVDFGSAGSLRLTGLGAQYNVLPASNPWAFGPLVSFRQKRDADVKDEVVKTLREVDAAAEIGGFVEYGLQSALTQDDRLAFGAELKSGKGGLFALTTKYLFASRGAFQFGADARMVFANSRYMDTYFSVDADNSLRSGLPVYKAGSGLKDVGLGVSTTYDLGSKWLLFGRVGVTRLVGDAADSPIVDLRGRQTSANVAVGVGYRF